MAFLTYLESLEERASDDFYCFHLKSPLNRWDQGLESEISMLLGKALFSKALLYMYIYMYLLKVKYKPRILFTSGPYTGDINLHTPGCKVLEYLNCVRCVQPGSGPERRHINS